MSSIKDVAKLANVSISTVSLAFNQPSRVSDKKRKKIFEAAKQLGFTLNMRLKEDISSESIMFVATTFPNIYAPFYNGVQDASSAEGVKLLPLLVEDYSDSEIYAVLESAIRKRRIAGILFAGSFGSLENAAHENGIPMVNSLIESSDSASTLLNNYKTGADMAHHFVKTGFRSIAYIGDDEHTRMRGFIETLDKYGMTPYDSGNWRKNVKKIDKCAETYKFINDVLLTQNDLPDAVFCMTDMIAIGLMSALESYGLKIPDDVAVAGCENIELSQLVVPQLTTMAIPRYEQGVQAYNLLRRMIAGGPEERIVFDAKLIIRGSTSPNSGYK